jgi:hypothetical protein
VNVTLSPSLDLLVSRMARVSRSSKSNVLRELLEAAEPSLARAVALMEAAERAASAVKSGLADNLKASQDQIEKVLEGQLARIDSMTSDLVGMAESIQSRAPAKVAAKRETPLPSKRGVKSSSGGARRASSKS